MGLLLEAAQLENDGNAATESYVLHWPKKAERAAWKTQRGPCHFIARHPFYFSLQNFETTSDGLRNRERLRRAVLRYRRRCQPNLFLAGHLGLLLFLVRFVLFAFLVTLLLFLLWLR